MNKIQFEKVIKPLVEIYDEIELDLIRNILEKLDNYHSVQGSLEWYLEKLQEQNTLSKENLKVFKKNKLKIKKALRKILADTNRQKNYSDMLEQIQQKGVLRKGIDLYNSPAINSVINNALNDCIDITNLINSKAIEATNEVYKKIINKAYVESASGIYTYTESIRKALNDMAKQGIDVVHYESGRKLGIESVIRRDVVSRLGKVEIEKTLVNAKKLGTNLVYVLEHLGARVRTPYMKHDYEAHAEWQGEVYKIADYNEQEYPNGSDKYTKDLYEYTGFGEMLGLGGINCYHEVKPFYRWEDKPEHEFTQEENAEQYELYQKQRAFERKIRRLKREKLVNKNYDKEKYKAASNRLKNINKEFEEFLDKNDLKRDYNREYINENIKITNHDASNHIIGEFDISKYTKKIKSITNDVVLLPERIEHISKHKDVVKYLDRIKNILNEPDCIYVQNDEIDTIWLTKKIDENVKLTLKLITNKSKNTKYKNSIVQMQIMNEKRIKNYLKKGKISLLFDKNNNNK